MTATVLRWMPAAIFAVGAVMTNGVDPSPARPLRMTLGAAVPTQVANYQSSEMTISEDERRIVGVTSYLARAYLPSEAGAPVGFTLYIGYYDTQVHGKTAHSPKNCLPGSGWEPLQASTASIQTPGGPVEVNRYLIQKGQQQALVLYWYQGRGRIQASEYAVKWNLLRDAALRGRSDEALVRIVVPLTGGTEAAMDLARRVAETLVPQVNAALPA